MATKQDPQVLPDGSKKRSAASSKGDAAFRGHLMVYIVTGLFLFTLNLLTSPREWWFYWPLFFWGWALVFQALATYGTEAPARAMETLRSIVPGGWRSASTASSTEVRSSSGQPFAAASFASAHEKIEHLKAVAWQLPEGQAREQAIRIANSAERIAGVMAADRIDAATVDRFTAQYLQPAESLLTRFARLSSRGVSGAEETLKRVEEQNLPLLESRFDGLYDQLHRGEIVDLAVASEMLDFDLPDPPHALHGLRH